MVFTINATSTNGNPAIAKNMRKKTIVLVVEIKKTLVLSLTGTEVTTTYFKLLLRTRITTTT
jgi:hypothetical protein